MQSYPFESGGPQQRSKMAIPRLDRGQPPPRSFKSTGKTKEERIGRACKMCRKRKIRCSGETPSCSNCQLISADCVYEASRRDRLKEATELNHTLISLLQDLSTRVDKEDMQKINDAIEDANEDLISQRGGSPQTFLGKRSHMSMVSEEDTASGHGEVHVTASVGSNENLDHLDEDLLRSHESRAAGYIGQNSEVRWLSSVQRQTEHTGAEPAKQPYGPPGEGQEAVTARSDALHKRRNNTKAYARQASMPYISESTFYLDHESLDINSIIDLYADPEPEVAERLFNCYYQTVHPSFPLVPEDFTGEFRKYLKSLHLNGACTVPLKTRAQINLLFAIGAKYSHLIGATWAGEKDDHLEYMARAIRLLGLKETIMILSEPDIQIVHAMGSLAFYFLVIGHVSRAWVMIGLAIRLALALGLHLRNEDVGVGESNKESRVLTWWSLNSIECLMSTTTGRPSAVSFEDCTVPLPHSIPDERENILHRRTERGSMQSSQGRDISHERWETKSPRQHHLDHINVTIITQKVLLDLYSPRTAAKSWEFIEEKISEHLERLEAWASATLSQDTKSTFDHNSQANRGQFLLRTEYWSTKILITRPCVCRIEERISDESRGSTRFNIRTARTCVDAALEMVKLFPNDPDLDFVYSTGPWWAITHLIVQSMAVLLLDMAYAKNEKEVPNPNIMWSIKKLIRWLRTLQYSDPVAARAYQVIWKILKAVAPELQAKANELLSTDDEVDTQPRAFHHQSTHATQENYMPASHEEYGAYPMNPHGTLNSQPNYAPQFNNPSAFQPAQNDTQPISLGHPFFTSFDQATPFASMQDMWTDPGVFHAFDMNWPEQDSQPDEFTQASPGADPNVPDITPREHRDWMEM